VDQCGLCERQIPLGQGIAAFRGGMAHIPCWLDWRDGRLRAPRPVVLVVEDDEPTLYTTRRALAPHFGLIEATTAQAALVGVTRGPDLVLLDLQLPDLDGLEVCRRIKTDPATAWTRVLPFTAVFTSEHDRQRAMDAGADGYLLKPIPAGVLVASVRRLVGIA
jgi:CheY-like chemotaxis protein